MEQCKQLPAIIHPITDIYPNLNQINVSLTTDCSSSDVIAVNVCASILFFAALQDDDEVKEKMDKYGIDADSVNEAAEAALEIFRSFMGFDEE